MAAVREEPQDALGVFAVFRRSGRREYCGGVRKSRGRSLTYDDDWSVFHPAVFLDSLTGGGGLIETGASTIIWRRKSLSTARSKAVEAVTYQRLDEPGPKLCAASTGWGSVRAAPGSSRRWYVTASTAFDRAVLRMTIDADEIRTAIRPPPPVNESRKTAGWNTDQSSFAVLISSASIVIFGEILPQALCSQHGLRIGARCTVCQWAASRLTEGLVDDHVG
jgi:hypothetical protein